jgi:hypothetical protein
MTPTNIVPNKERFRTEIGADAYNDVVALAECKYEIAIANAGHAVSATVRPYPIGN